MKDRDTGAQKITKPGWLKRISDFGSRFIDYKMGFIGAGVMGTIVFFLNYEDAQALPGASTAALKQAGYTFLFGGSIMKSCELLATKIKREVVALAAAVLIPSAVAIGLTFGVHSIKGTPKPLVSTIPTAVLVIPSTAVWGYRKQKQQKVTTRFMEKSR